MPKPHFLRCTIALLPLIGWGAGGAADATAQDPAERDRDCVCLFDAPRAPLARRAMLRTTRARIGVTLGETREVGGRTGVEILRVEDDGPADRAGLRARDVLLAIGGEGLGAEPAAGLMERLGRAEPGDTVTVEYHRDGQSGTVSVVTEPFRWMHAAGVPGLRGMAVPRMELRPLRAAGPDGRPGFLWRRDGLRLVDMNAGLGEYFGVSEGVLVAESGAESLGLEPGDVILTIGGRAVRDAEHARAIIASFRPDEEIRFEIQRRNRRTTITGRIER